MSEISPGRVDTGPGRYVALVVMVASVAVAGYVGYVLFPRFDLPPLEGVALLGLAGAAGVASFFSPCSFPLLLAFLGRRRGDGSTSSSRSQSLLFGGAVAIGAAVFLILVGGVIAVGGGATLSEVTFDSTAGIIIRVVVGALLVFLGLAQTGVIPISLHSVSRVVQPLLGTQTVALRIPPLGRHLLFGFGYILAGFG